MEVWPGVFHLSMTVEPHGTKHQARGRWEITKSSKYEELCGWHYSEIWKLYIRSLRWILNPSITESFTIQGAPFWKLVSYCIYTFWLFWDRVSCSTGWPQTYYVGESGLEYPFPSSSTSWVLDYRVHHHAWCIGYWGLNSDLCTHSASTSLIELHPRLLF